MKPNVTRAPIQVFRVWTASKESNQVAELTFEDGFPSITLELGCPYPVHPLREGVFRIALGDARALRDGLDAVLKAAQPKPSDEAPTTLTPEEEAEARAVTPVHWCLKEHLRETVMRSTVDTWIAKGLSPTEPEPYSSFVRSLASAADVAAQDLRDWPAFSKKGQP